MAKKRATKKTSRQPSEAPRICFERIIPDELDPERMARRSLRSLMEEQLGPKPSLAERRHVARMAIEKSKKWQTGMTLKCRFLDGSPSMRKKVEANAHKWEEFANVKFKFVTTGTAEIRISFFADDGSWSAVGRDALNERYFPPHQPTMNYGWLRDNTDAKEYSRVVIHEFGHALGCIHEHSSPTFGRKWNVAAVMRYFQGPPNFWSPEDIKFNVLDQYPANKVIATEYDPKSIMLYAFDASLFSDGKGPTNSNTTLSVHDKAMIKRLYS